MRAAIISAAAVLAAVFFLLFGMPGLGHDAVQYDLLGYNLASGHGFSLGQSSPYAPTMIRDPGYPFFLACIYKIFGHRLDVVVLGQIILHAATAILTYRLAGAMFDKKVAFFSGLAVAVFPTLANTSLYILSETLFTFILCFSVYAYVLGMKTYRAVYFISAGILMGLLTLTKAVALFMPFMLVVSSFLSAAAKRVNIKRAVVGITLCVVLFCLTVSAWSLRNKAAFNTYSLTIRSGEVLWSRASKIDNTMKDTLADMCYNFSEFLGGKLFPDPSVKPERYLYKGLDRAEALAGQYAKEGISEPQIDSILKKQALDKIVRHPVKYISYSFIEAIKMTAFTYLPLLNESRTTKFFGSFAFGRLVLSVTKVVFRMFALPLLVLFIISLVKNARIWDRWLVVAAVVLYFNVICSLMDAIGRYAVPLIPFYCITAISVLYREEADA